MSGTSITLMFGRVLLAVGALGWLAGCKGSGPAAESEPHPVVEVRVAAASPRDLTEALTVPGTLFPISQAAVAAKIAAPIKRLLVSKGSRVKTGELLAELENRDLTAAVREAEANLAEAESTLSKLSLGTLPGDLERAQAQVATTRAALESLQKIHDRRKALYEQGAISNKDLLTTQAELAAAQSNYQVAVKSLELLQTQSREKDLAIARSRVEQARARVQNARAQLAFTEIRSSLSGVVTDQWMYPGDMAKPDAPMLTVMDTHVMIVRAQVPEAEVAKLRLKQEVAFEPQDLPGQRFPGVVQTVGAAIDRASRTVEIWVRVENPRGVLRAGSYGTLSAVTRKIPQALTVPRSAVLLEEGGHDGTVMVVGADQIAHERKVKTGLVEGEWIQIEEGLRAGERVVSDGNYGLPDKTQVKIK